MAVDHLQFSPTTDIHLIKGGAGIPVTITAYSYNPYSATDVTAQVLGSLSLSAPNIVQITGTTLTPVSAGETLGVMSYADSGNTHYLLLRVRVHNSIQSIWFGNNKVTLTTGATCKLSVYAKFDDNSFGDITGHPSLNFSSAAAAFVTVDPSGTATGVATGSSLIDVTGPGTDHVVVTVRDFVTPNPIVERIWGSGAAAERRNLLILAEGFASADQPHFDQWKLEVSKRILQTKSHSPYNLLKDSWNVWAAFEPSSESGVSVGYPVTVPNSNGNVAPFDFTKPDPNGPRILQAKDTRYGLIYAARPGERTSMALTTAPKGTDWYNPWKQYRIFTEDARRTGVLTTTYFDSLKNKDVASGAPDYDIGQRWKFWIAAVAPSPNGAVQAGNVVTLTTTSAHGLSAGMQVQIDEVDVPGYNGLQTVQAVPSPTTFTYNLLTTGLAGSGGGRVGGADRGLVALLVNDDTYAGVQAGKIFAACLGQNEHFHAVVDPTTSALDHSPVSGNVVLDAVSAVFAHEMAHALGLGDEYEGNDNTGYTRLANNPSEDKRIEAYGNLTVLDTIIGVAGTAINTSAIKWNWDRMTQSSRLAQDLAAPAGATFDIVLNSGEGKNWAAAQSNATDVYLRRRIVDQSVPNPLLLREGPLKVTNINGDTLTLQGAVGANGFKQGSVLYLPKKDSSGQILTLIPAQVLTFITHGAFPRPDTTCKTASQDSEDPPDIPGFHYPRHNRDLVGLYTGGGWWNCNVFRPCGYCKMRDSVSWQEHWSWWNFQDVKTLVLPDFCFVCKYFIVDLIDAGQHQVLDKEYPEDC